MDFEIVFKVCFGVQSVTIHDRRAPWLGPRFASYASAQPFNVYEVLGRLFGTLGRGNTKDTY